MSDIDDEIETDETDRLIASDRISGQVEYTVLQFGGLSGLGSDHYPLPWGELGCDTGQGGYVVDIGKETLAALRITPATRSPSTTGTMAPRSMAITV